MDDVKAFNDMLLHGTADELRILIANGQMDVNRTFINGNKPLHEAIWQGCSNHIRVLLDAGADPTPHVIHAMVYRHPDTALLLIEYGADPNYGQYLDAFEHSYITNLITAVRCSYFEVAEALLRAGADVNMRNKVGNTAIMCANTLSVPMLKLLIDAGADVNLRDNAGQTALDWFNKYKCRCTSIDTNIKLMEEMLITETYWQRRRHLLMFICDLDAHEEAAGGRRIGGGPNTRKCLDIFDLNREILAYM